MRKKLFSSLYFQVLLAITLGVLLGHVYPELGADMKPLGDGFVKLIKMIIAPVIFCTVVTGIAGMESMKAVGKTGAIALLYFEVVSTIALIIGLCVVNLLQPGVGMNVDPAALDASAISAYAEQAKSQGIIAFLLDIIPGSVIGAFAITNDVVIIMLGLAIGAMFVRSTTVYLVKQGTLDEYVYLEHGAHYAIGILALIMFITMKFHVPEIITGLIGIAFIAASVWSSLHYRKTHAEEAEDND